MKRILGMVAAVLLVAACSDSELSTGPEADGPATNITTVGPSGGLVHGLSDICGTIDVDIDGDGVPEQVIASPCDGDSNLPSGPSDPNALDPAKLPYTGSSFWLSSLEKSPSPIPANIGGLADRLHVRAYPYPNEAACQALAAAQGLNGVDCGVRDLEAVTEVTDGAGLSLRYATSWKTKKSKQGGPGAGDFVPNNSYWQVVAFFDFDGDGAWAGSSTAGDSDEDLISRIIKWTDTPSSDNPLDGWSLDINWGSNQPIPFVIEDDGSKCFGTARAEDLVECLVDFDDGFLMILETDLGAVIFEGGAGNNLGVRTVRGTECTGDEIDVDAATAGTCTNWSVIPPLLPSDPDLIDSAIYVCEDLTQNDPNYDPTSYILHIQDALGTQALDPIDLQTAADFCQLYGFLAYADDPGTGVHYVLNRIKQLFVPAKLIAGHGSSGSRITTVRSDFQLVQTAQMQALGGQQSFTVSQNGSVTLKAIVNDHADNVGGIAVCNSDIYVYAEGGTGSTLACPVSPDDPTATCTDLATWPSWAGDGVLVNTGDDGEVEVVATLGLVSAEVRMLGCSIAVPGSDTPASGGFPGDGSGGCDRDPADQDGPDGYANGIGVGIVDPFMRDGVFVPVWANDLPLIYTLQVCSVPDVNGVNDADDPWSKASPSSCVEPTNRASFEVNVGGNLGGNQGPVIADLEWFVGTDGNGDRRVYFGLDVPLSKDPTSGKVSTSLTFDAGDGSTAGTADEYDDQIVLVLDKFSTNPLGDISDRYLKSSCTSGTSACNSDDSDLGGDLDAQGAMSYQSGSLFIELSQKLNGDVPVDLHGLTTGDILGFVLQFGVGNVQQGGTQFPDQQGGTNFQAITIP